MQQLILIIIFSLFTLTSFAKEANLNTWGFDLGFGQEKNMENLYTLGLLTPTIFNLGASSWTGYISYTAGDISFVNNSSSVKNIDFLFKINSPIYKGVIQNYTKLGLGAVLFDDQIYKDLVISLPLGIGVDLITSNDKGRASSFYIEWLSYIFNNYDEVKSIPSQALTIQSSDIFKIRFNIGFRQTF